VIHPVIHTFCCLLLATNYFAFQVELFEEEYEQNHRTMSECESFAAPTLTWESFDKNNAPKAFTIEPLLFGTVVAVCGAQSVHKPPPRRQTSIIRDKSPPSGLRTTVQKRFNALSV